MLSIFIGWLTALLLGLPILGTLNNEQLELAYFAYNKALEEGINPARFIKLVYCESRFERNARGDYRIETDEYMAFGPAQWWRSSWDNYAKKYDYFGDYKNPYNQITLAAAVISQEKNGIYNWKNCGKLAGYDLK